MRELVIRVIKVIKVIRFIRIIRVIIIICGCIQMTSDEGCNRGCIV